MQQHHDDEIRTRPGSISQPSILDENQSLDKLRGPDRAIKLSIGASSHDGCAESQTTRVNQDAISNPSKWNSRGIFTALTACGISALLIRAILPKVGVGDYTVISDYTPLLGFFAVRTAMSHSGFVDQLKSIGAKALMQGAGFAALTTLILAGSPAMPYAIAGGIIGASMGLLASKREIFGKRS